MYLYLKALHIIFVVTWFAGMFYMVRLLVYQREAQDKGVAERDILTRQLQTMAKRLWFGITWPSAILTFVVGNWMLIEGGYGDILLEPGGRWLLIKYILVLALYAYHLSIQVIYRQTMRGEFRYTSHHLRLWNEVPTLFLFAIVFLAVVKQGLSAVWGVLGIVVLGLLLFGAVRIYRLLR